MTKAQQRAYIIVGAALLLGFLAVSGPWLARLPRLAQQSVVPVLALLYLSPVLHLRLWRVALAIVMVPIAFLGFGMMGHQALTIGSAVIAMGITIAILWRAPVVQKV